MFGEHTWRIENFSKINEKQLVCNTFEVGGYDWNLLIYPKGHDVYDHISAFLNVANLDKLLPGWSHLAQFTLVLVNKDAKKLKRNDAIYRFNKKWSNWGWRKFLNLSALFDDFIYDDTLVIKAQVQVIRVGSDETFPCLDYKYRRLLLRSCLHAVELSYIRFVRQQRDKLRKLVKDEAGWSSFCAFWLGMDQSSRRSMSQVKAETILKEIEKLLFYERDPTSTLIMDFLYIGMKVLEEADNRFVHVEKHEFALVGDVLLQLERAADMKPLSCKCERGVPDYTEEPGPWEEYHERRLTELGSQTIEIFVLAYVFSKIEAVYYQDSRPKGHDEQLK